MFRLRRLVAVLLGVLLLQLTLQESAWACVWMPHGADARVEHAGMTPATSGDAAAAARGATHRHGAVAATAGAATVAASQASLATPGRETVRRVEPGAERSTVGAVGAVRADAASAARHDADDPGGRPCLPGTAHLGCGVAGCLSAAPLTPANASPTWALAGVRWPSTVDRPASITTAPDVPPPRG